MSSPGARQRRRREQYQNPRTRSELLTAIGAGVGIVAGTALMIWLLRPGGLADRQPRSSWLISLALIAALTAVYMILRRDNRREMNQPIALAISLGAIVVVAVVVGIVWPGGLLRHTPTIPTLPPTPSTQATSPPTSTGGVTTSAPAGATTTVPGAGTTAPGATTAPTTPGNTPTSGATATTRPSTSPTATAPPVSPSP